MPNQLTVLDDHAGLAAELAQRLESADVIFERHGIEDEDANALLTNPQFQSMLKQARLAWDAVNNASERVRLKAVVALEEMLPKMYGRAVDPDTPVAAANDTFKIFKGLAGMDSKEPAEGGSRFSVVINLPGKTPMAIEAERVEEDA